MFPGPIHPLLQRATVAWYAGVLSVPKAVPLTPDDVRFVVCRAWPVHNAKLDVAHVFSEETSGSGNTFA